MADSVIRLRNVSFLFAKGAKVIDDASMDINRSDFVAVVGPNGGGKTTLVKLILGVFEPVEGEVFLFGRKPDNISRARAGYVPQNNTSFDQNFPATVFEIVMTGLVPGKGLFQGMKRDARELAEKSLDLVKMLGYRDQRIGDLSGGQKQRVLIARALVNKPDLLVLDEPTVGVDSASQMEFYSILMELNRSGTTIIIVSHDTSTVSRYVNKVVCVNQRVIVHSAEAGIPAACGSQIHKHIIHDH